jgi:hypothetical protein
MAEARLAVIATLSKGYDLDYIWRRVSRDLAKDAAGYYLRAGQTGGESPGRWWGPGAQAPGLEPGEAVEREPYDLLFGQRKGSKSSSPLSNTWTGSTTGGCIRFRRHSARRTRGRLLPSKRRPHRGRPENKLNLRTHRGDSSTGCSAATTPRGGHRRVLRPRRRDHHRPQSDPPGMACLPVGHPGRTSTMTTPSIRAGSKGIFLDMVQIDRKESIAEASAMCRQRHTPRAEGQPGIQRSTAAPSRRLPR